jgi:hypothetical protein
VFQQYYAPFANPGRLEKKVSIAPSLILEICCCPIDAASVSKNKYEKEEDRVLRAGDRVNR